MSTLGKRIRLIRSEETQAEFADRVGIAKGSIGGYENDKNSPSAEAILKICLKNDISFDWLLTGRGPMRPNHTSIGHLEAVKQPETLVSEPCARCAKLESKLEKVEEQRDSLMEENRKLWKENAELREKCARLEERQGQSEAAPFGECCSTNLPCSNHLHERP